MCGSIFPNLYCTVCVLSDYVSGLKIMAKEMEILMYLPEDFTAEVVQNPSTFLTVLIIVELS